jgi:hypothetical protein
VLISILNSLGDTVVHELDLITITMNRAIDNIRNYAAEVRGLQDHEMEVDVSDAGTEARLDQTIKELQWRLRARKLELAKVRVYSA